MDSPALLLIVAPVTYIFLSNIWPVHSSHTALLILLPFSLEEIARGVIVHLAVAFLHVISKTALENAAALEDNFAPAVLLPFHPLAFVSSIIDAVFASAMTKAVFDLPFIGASIRPAVRALACDTIVSELSLIDYAVGPSELAFAVE